MPMLYHFERDREISLLGGLNRGISGQIIAGYAKNQVVQHTASIEQTDSWNKMLRL